MENNDELYIEQVDSDLIDKDFDEIDPNGEIMEESGNGEHKMDDIDLTDGKQSKK